jgi:hypothetical protein
MSPLAKQAGLAKWSGRYARADQHYKTKILDGVLALFDCHRKSAIRMVRSRLVSKAAAYALGRPKTYDPERVLPPWQAIRNAAF